MSFLDDQISRADPAGAYDLLDPGVAAALADVARAAVPAPRARKTRARLRRRRVVALLAAGAVLAAASAAGASWLGAHTGIFGQPGLTENDTSEFLRIGSPEMAAIARDYGRDYPLPPGGSYDPAIAQLVHGEGLIQATGVRSLVAMASACQWEREWLRAHVASQARRARRAEAVLSRVPHWRVVRATDGGGIVEWHMRIARSARLGAAGLIRRDLAINCEALLP
jgi:hypothetical protein